MQCSFRKSKWYSERIKFAIDFVFAVLLFLISSPLLLLVMLLLKLFQKGPVFFVQERIGYHCQPFHIFKFRTMSDAVDAEGELLPDEDRTTCIGSFLRATSLDELPELINVLKGDMSFIGPRPWIPEQMAHFPVATQQKRMTVRPGLSGLAQVMGRNNLTFRERVSIDLRYIRNQCARMDVCIFFLTIYKIFKREGIAQHPDAMRHGSGAKDPETIGKRGNYLEHHPHRN